MAIDVLGYFQPEAGAGYVALDPPTRHLDTRTGTGLRRTAPSAPNGTYNLKVARYDGVPADAAAVMLSVVAVAPSSGGLPHRVPGRHAAARRVEPQLPRRAPPPPTRCWPASGPTAGWRFYNAAGNTHVISDLAGYFIDPANVQLPPP